MIDGPEGAGYDYTVQQVQQVEAMLAPHVGADKPIVRANPRVPGGWGASEEMHTGRVSIFLQPWRQRSEGTPEVANELQKELDTIRGVRVHRAGRAGIRRDRAVARSHPAAHGRQSRPGRPGLGLQGTPAAAAGEHRPPACGRPRRAGHRDRFGAGNHDGLAPRHHFRRQRRGV
ncbi:hypothetical protein G6F46_014088 [Rhizopus delemar]|nr:hypothetical protein G6F46_014088 [Rhizopus delemar]